MQKIEWQQLEKAFPAAAEDHLQNVADELNRDLAKYGLDTPLRQAHFFAQVRQEGGPKLEGQVENLNYRPEALMKFSYYKKHPAEAETDGYAKDPKTNKITRPANQEAIANKAYARAELGNGDASSGDGWRYRGRGFMQVTGKANYTSLNNVYKNYYDPEKNDFVAHPELLEQFPYNIRSAVCFWNSHGLPKLADAGSKPAHVDAITAVVNKQTDSYEKRQENFAAIYPLLT